MSRRASVLIAALLVVTALYVTLHVVSKLLDVRLLPTQQHEPREEPTDGNQ